MKKVYVAHPLLGNMDPERPNISIAFQNKQSVDDICQRIADIYPDVLILSPIHAFSFFDVFERKRTFAACRELFYMADELWVFGDWETSEGCKKEIMWAEALDVPIVYHKEGALLGN